MINIADILSREIVAIPGCPGYSIAIGATAPAYVRELARTATIRSSHPWVLAENTDAQLLAAIKDYWATAKPGWLRDSDDATIIALHAHGGIANHLPHDAVLLTPELTSALAALRVKPALAARKVHAYLGFGGIAGEHTVLDLVLTDGSTLVESKRVLDQDAYDDQDIERYDTIAVRGKSVRQAVIAGEIG